MTLNIFAATAPAYWAAKLPVIPLYANSKLPAVPSWSRNCTEFPDTSTQYSWLAVHAHGNIGLPLGALSGVVVLDIDLGSHLSAFIQTRLADCITWIRCGSKGKALAFKYAGEKPFRLYGEKGTLICELLTQGQQIVLAPSIHPTTQQPYIENYPLHKAELKTLPEGVDEILNDLIIKYEETFGSI
jgi:putative DNA primase/helicase